MKLIFKFLYFKTTDIVGQTRNPILSNIIWLFLDKIYGAIITLYIYSRIGIYFGSELFGVWNYITSFSTIILAIGALGLNFIVVKRVKRNPILQKYIISNAFYLRLFFGFITAVFFLILYLIIGVNCSEEYLMAVLFIFTSQVVLSANVMVFLNEAKLHNKWNVITKNISITFAFVLKLIAIRYEMNISVFAAINLIELVLYFILIFKIPRNRFSQLSTSYINKKIIISLLKDGLPLLLASVTVTIYLKIDQLIIAYLLGNEKVGIYAASSRLVEMLYVVPVIISNVFFPKIIQYYKQKHLKKASKILKILFAITLIATVFITLTINFSSKMIITFLFDEQYIESHEVLKLYAWSIIFMGFLVSSSKFLIAIDRNDIILIRGLIGLISNILLNFILIPVYGLIGAAWATLISYFLASYFSNIFFKELRPLMKDQITAVFSVKKIYLTTNK